MLEWVAISFSEGSSQLRGQTGVSNNAGGFFTTELPGKMPASRNRQGPRLHPKYRASVGEQGHFLIKPGPSGDISGRGCDSAPPPCLQVPSGQVGKMFRAAPKF